MKINMQNVVNTIFTNDETMIKGISLMTSVTMYEVNTKFLNYAEKCQFLIGTVPTYMYYRLLITSILKLGLCQFLIGTVPTS